MMAGEVLSPFVFWGQNNECIFLKVDLRDCEKPEVHLDEDNLSFKANGVGSHGRKDYGFKIEFYLSIEAEKSKLRVTDRNIEFQLNKTGVGEIWPRLTVSQHKPSWLKIDFDKFAMDEDSEEEAKRQEAETKVKEEKLWEKLDKDLKETQESAIMDIKSIWLFIYNMFQWVGYSYVFAALCFKYMKDGEESKYKPVLSVGGQLMVCQLAAILEIIHPLLGLVKTGVLSPLMQVFGRNFVLFFVILPEENMHDAESVWWLFIVWSSIEIVRYPFYMLSSINKESYMITWLRYTLWIPLYPLGFLTEGLVLLKAIPLYERSGRFSLELPNMYNMAFPFPIFLRIYFLIFLMGMCSLLKRMYIQRQKKMKSLKKVKSKTS